MGSGLFFRNFRIDHVSRDRPREGLRREPLKLRWRMISRGTLTLSVFQGLPLSPRAVLKTAHHEPPIRVISPEWRWRGGPRIWKFPWRTRGAQGPVLERLEAALEEWGLQDKHHNAFVWIYTLFVVSSFPILISEHRAYLQKTGRSQRLPEGGGLDR